MAKFQKGESGNTATQFQTGNQMQREKGYEQIKTVIKRILSAPNEENPDISNNEAVVIALTRKALTGDVQAATALYDRVHGKPKASIEVGGNTLHNLRYENLDELRGKMRLAKLELEKIDNE